MSTARLIIEDSAKGQFKATTDFEGGFNKDSQAHQQCYEASQYINTLADAIISSDDNVSEQEFLQDELSHDKINT